MKRLLYITNGISGSGGLERVLSVKAGYLADKLGYDVHILVLNNNGQAFFYDFSHNIKIHDIAVIGNPLSYIKSYVSGVISTVKSINPDIISVCDDGLKGFFVPLILGKSYIIIYERHVSKVIALGVEPGFVKKIAVQSKYALMNLLGRRFDKFILLTKDNASEWSLDNIDIIPNPLPFFPKGSSSLTNRRVIAVGKQSHQKGFDLLLQAWKIIAWRFPDWELRVYGKIDPAQRLDQQAAVLGLSKQVQFFPPVKNIESEFLASSVFAFPSRFEGFGMVLIEAMACGVPCVSFDCPHGPADIVSDGEDGFLVENGNVDGFAQKLALLMGNEEMRKSFGIAAKENARRYLPEVIVPQWDKLFKSLLNQR
jgi:glycosyltransferase involved in cell wall biosynthesis